MEHRGSAPGISGVMDDVVKLAETIERLSRSGRRIPAADAIELGEYVEKLIDMLVQEVDDLVASGSERA